MSNAEVVAFVDRFRSVCPISPTLVSAGPISPTSVSISHLLCEEARYRWFGVVESDDVMVDDISCIIIQLFSSTQSVHPPNRRISRVINVLGDLDESPKLGPRKHPVVLRDLMRGKEEEVEGR